MCLIVSVVQAIYNHLSLISLGFFSILNDFIIYRHVCYYIVSFVKIYSHPRILLKKHAACETTTSVQANKKAPHGKCLP